MYRYIDDRVSSSEICHPTLLVFDIEKETPKGYWIKDKFYSIFGITKPIWVSKTARKRYAYPTKEEALHNYIKRKESQIKILSSRLQRAKESLISANKIQNDINN